MRILLASSEAHPYCKTGGLADMVGALARSLAALEQDVALVVPLYQGIREKFPRMQRTGPSLKLQLGPGEVRGDVWTLEAEAGLKVLFVDQPEFFDRPNLYHKDGLDFPDNAARFTFFSKAVAYLARHLPLKPQLVHAHDWQTGLVPLLIAHQRKAEGWTDAPRTCLTIHNLAYQGLFPATLYPLTNLPWDYYTSSGVEFYGKMGCLKAGIVFSDVITAVSPRYAREITAPELGCGLDGLLRYRQQALFGILNGVDYREWNPATDPSLKHPYSREDMAGKAANKLELLKEFGLPADEDVPLFGNVGRLVEQKGVDILLEALKEMLQSNIRLVMLGTGVPAVQAAFQDLARQFPGKASVRIGFDETLSHQIEAGSDFFLMPSRFEPCGLNQLYSLRYGTIPIVRKTGGLDDTIIDATENLDAANGIKFNAYAAPALAKGIRKALALYEEKPLLRRFQMNAMSADFSEERTAAEYMKVYEKALAAGVGPNGSPG